MFLKDCDMDEDPEKQSHDVVRTKKRIFVCVQDVAPAPCTIYAVSEDEKHLFRREVERTDCFKNLMNGDKDFPAMRAFAEFERFCVDECGLIDPNDEVIFTNCPDLDLHDVFSYVAWQLGGVPWAVVKFVESRYKHETTHLASPLSFEQFVLSCDIDLAEPYATKHLYAEYLRLIHKDGYTPQELDRMEACVVHHIHEAYLSDGSNLDAICAIAHVCVGAYLSDNARFLRLVEWIVSDFNRRRCKGRRSALADILIFIADEVADHGYIDYDVVATEENKPPLERSEYAIFRAVAPDKLKTIKNILEEYDK